MTYLNKELSQIKIIELIILAFLFLIFILIIGEIFQVVIDEEWIYISLILFIFYKLRHCGNDFKKQFKNIFNRFSFKHILFIVLINIFFSCGMIIVSDLFLDSLSYSIIPSLKIIGVLSGIISSVIIAPLFEELLFRGIILQKLNKRLGIIVSILISSILFGIIHDLGGIFSAFIFGICMCILYIKSNNILVPIFAHALNNLIAEALYLIDPSEMIFTDIILISIFSVLAIISAILLLLFFSQYLKGIDS
ncbi:CPBP family intramembrane metalloprotease [Methanobrevibacter sp. OttesenSCG-928-I08]|nr:CPBP family intramembrane metalloprotease [Methanobrevibacter sp. OttesenSCG-928-I08]